LPDCLNPRRHARIAPCELFHLGLPAAREIKGGRRRGIALGHQHLGLGDEAVPLVADLLLIERSVGGVVHFGLTEVAAHVGLEQLAQFFLS